MAFRYHVRLGVLICTLVISTSDSAAVPSTHAWKEPACPSEECWEENVRDSFPEIFNGPSYLPPSGPHGAHAGFSSEGILGVDNRTFAVQPSTIKVRAASPGSWNPSAACPTPRMWVLLYGQYRTWDITQQSIAKMIRLSAGSCYFVVGVAAHESGIKVGAKDLAFTHDADVAEGLKKAQSNIFGGLMAYVVADRTGMFDRRASLQGALDFFWYSSFICAEMAASYHGIAPMASSLVLRTRFDVSYDKYYFIDHIIEYFERGERGQHLALGQETTNSQGDFHMMTSFGAYSRDIAGAYASKKYRLARSNGWGYGFSICGFKSECSDQTRGGPSLDLAPACLAADVQEPYSSECCPDNEPCMLTVVQSVSHPKGFIVKENRTAASEGFARGRAIDLTKGLTMYCPDAHADMEAYSVPWLQKFGGPFYHKPIGEDLVGDGGEEIPKFSQRFGGAGEGGGKQEVDERRQSQIPGLWPPGC